MENSNYALVLTGEVLPGYSPESVWPALATYFRMDAERFNAQLLARAPLSIKQSDDLGKLQTLQAGAAAVGAATEICAPDDRSALFVLLDNTARGPVPFVLVEEHIEHGLWPLGLTVAEVGSKTWRPFRELAAPARPGDVATPAAPFDATAHMSADHASSHAPTHAPDRGHNLAGVAASQAIPSMPEQTLPLPAGATIHAGFWRRCAALLIDGLLLGAVLIGVQVVLGVGSLSALDVSDAGIAAIFGAMMMLMLVAFVGQWLYFALFESASVQATPGKMAMGIKVVDDSGRRIGFGRASGRYFSKIISGMILNIGYLLAGFTERKQALHDMLAGTLVVFRAVRPGQPAPETRPPMPWYGWLVNIVVIGGFVLALVAFWSYAAILLSALGSRDSQGF